MKKIALLMMLFLIVNLTKAQKSTDAYEDALKMIDIWLEAQKDYEDIPGIMGVVVKDQEIIWSGAFGESNIEANIPSNTNTACSICSISKVFTATAIMKLVSEGKLNLEDKIKDILPIYSIRQKYPEQGYVTIQSLLTHSSGVPRDTEHSYWSGPDFPFPSKKEVLDNLPKLETEYPVGSNIRYSNLGYALLGLVIEEVSGLSYKEYLETQLFRPLGMNNSVVEMQKPLYGSEHAIGYTARNRDRKRLRANFFQTRAMQPAAGISTTVLDLAKFASWQFRLMDASETELLTPDAIQSMYAVQTSSKNGRAKRGYGYEVFTDADGNNWAMHGGICPGYVSYFKMDVSNKMAYAIMVNANRVRALRYVNGIIHILNEVDPSNQSEKKGLNLSQYSGFYNLNPWNSEYYIAPWGDGLAALYLPTESMQYALYFYKHKEGNVFQLLNENKEATDEEITFYLNEEGLISKVKNEGNFHYRKIN